MQVISEQAKYKEAYRKSEKGQKDASCFNLYPPSARIQLIQ